MRKGSVEQKRVYAGMNCGAEQSTRGAKETGEDHYHNFIQRRKISHVQHNYAKLVLLLFLSSSAVLPSTLPFYPSSRFWFVFYFSGKALANVNTRLLFYTSHYSCGVFIRAVRVVYSQAGNHNHCSLTIEKFKSKAVCAPSVGISLKLVRAPPLFRLKLVHFSLFQQNLYKYFRCSE